MPYHRTQIHNKRDVNLVHCDPLIISNSLTLYDHIFGQFKNGEYLFISFIKLSKVIMMILDVCELSTQKRSLFLIL